MVLVFTVLGSRYTDHPTIHTGCLLSLQVSMSPVGACSHHTVHHTVQVLSSTLNFSLLSYCLLHYMHRLIAVAF